MRLTTVVSSNKFEFLSSRFLHGAVAYYNRLISLVGGDLSFKAMQWALDQDDVRFPDKFVLFVLAYRDNHDEPHGCYPSFARMAKDCGLSRREVIYSLARLVAQGKIKRESRKNPDGAFSSNYYSFPQVWVVHQVHQGSAQRRKGVVHGVHPNLLKRTVNEPSRSALPISPSEEQQCKDKFLSEMKRIADSKRIQ